MTPHSEPLAGSMQKTQAWIREVAALLGEDDLHHAFVALRSTLHVIRDRLTVEQAAHLAAQLPVVLRGVFYDGYKPAHVPSRIRSGEEFLEALRREMHDTTPLFRERCTEALVASLRVIAGHVDPGAMVKLEDAMPRDLAPIWTAL